MRRLAAFALLTVLATLSLIAATKALAQTCSVPQIPIPASFFGMTQLSLSSKLYTTVIPNVGIGRLWDTSCVWSAVNTAVGTFTYTPCDSHINFIINTASARPAFVFGRTPSWAISGGVGSCTGGTFGTNGCPQPPADIGSGDATLIAMVNSLVAHLASTHPGVHWILECVNEADLTGEWQGTMAQLVTYCTDLRTAAHAADPLILVLGPSASTLNTSNVHLYTDGHNYAGTTGAANSMDAINIHAYLESCSVMCPVPETLATSLAAQVFGPTGLTAVGQPLAGKSVYFSEGSWGGVPSNNSMTQTQKRQYLAREYLYMLAYDIKSYEWYAFDSHTDNPSTGFGTMCVGAAPATCTSQDSATTFTTMQNWLVGATYSFPITSACNKDANGTWTCQLTTSPASTGSALLITNPTATPSVAVSSVYTKVLNWDGTSTPIVAHAVTASPDVVMAVP